MAIITRIMAICEKGKGKNIQKFALPADDPLGFSGTVELELQSGSVCSGQISRQSLHIETISKEERDQISNY